MTDPTDDAIAATAQKLIAQHGVEGALRIAEDATSEYQDAGNSDLAQDWQRIADAIRASH